MRRNEDKDMAETMKGLKRTHRCTEVTTANVGQTVTVMGWVQKSRNKGGIIFVDLRDRSGLLQIIFEQGDDPQRFVGAEEFAKAESLRSEYVIAVVGKVENREGNTNENMATGAIEVRATQLRILSESETPPFQIEADSKTKEELRLKYRYLDLRNPNMKKNIVMRSQIVAELRQRMYALNFMEITTPILTCSSPEGARDYLVPARNHPGKFYALPQAPQQFKQILMASGFDRYFQIAPCFRDEDARADRSPGEFYQLDMEMAFASQEDVFSIVEQVLPPVFEKYGIYKNASKAPFVRIPYLEAMDKYGSDKPDLRIDLVLTDATEVMQGCGFAAFEGQTVKAIVVDGFTATRKQIDAICAEVEVQTARKGFWFRVDENGEFVGGISKFLQDRKEEVIKALGLKNGDFVGLAAGKKLEAQKTAGVYRKLLGAASEKHMKKDCYEFCWIVDFPMYEIGEESGELEFCHNPFSMPQGGMDALNNQDPLEILAYQYDLVCNGVELSSGAVRNHDPEIMIKAFELVGLGEADVKAKFPAMYNAFCYGAPPHAGIAPGVDRMIMLICGEESIREIIPFPMNKNAMDIMMGAPGTVEQKQLDELHLAITAKPEE